MGRTAFTEPQCLYKGALYLYLTVELYLYSPYGPYGLYRASVPVQGCTFPLPYSRAIPLLLLWAVLPVQCLSACTRVTFTFTLLYFTLLYFDCTVCPMLGIQRERNSNNGYANASQCYNILPSLFSVYFCSVPLRLVLERTPSLQQHGLYVYLVKLSQVLMISFVNTNCLTDVTSNRHFCFQMLRSGLSQHKTFCVIN